MTRYNAVSLRPGQYVKHSEDELVRSFCILCPGVSIFCWVYASKCIFGCSIAGIETYVYVLQRR